MPDVYQGDEDEFLALVDPDNRRPVDWARAAHRFAFAEARAHPSGAGRAAGGQRVLRARAGGRDAVAYVQATSSPRRRAARRDAPQPPGDGWRELFAAEGVLLAAKHRQQ